MNKKPYLSPSLEDYLESIYKIGSEEGSVRIKDIADGLGVKMPSVVGALKILKEKGYLEYEKYEPLTLTDKGLSDAKSILERHTILANFLVKTVLLSPEVADETACKIEHVISPDTAERLKNLTKYIENIKENTPLNNKEWISIITGE